MKALVVFAPTASGKTAFVQRLFGKGSLSVFKGRGEVISADSQAVYRGLDIGTAKPTEQERAELPYHLVDIAEPSEQFGVGDFVSKADEAAKDIFSRGKIPVVVGGTGFYIRSFLMGLPHTPESPPLVRKQVKERLKNAGAEALFAELSMVDPISAKRIHVHDEYRICRALEVFYTSGKPLSSYTVNDTLREGYQFCTIILTRAKDELFSRIDERVDAMFDAGLADEVEALKARGVTKDFPGVKAIGYSEFFDEELISQGLGAVRNAIKLHSRQYAKKQYTFTRGIPGATYIDANDGAALAKHLEQFFKEQI